MPTSWNLELFGALRVLDARGEVVIERFRTHKTAALLAMLALSKNARRRDELCAHLWPDAAPEAARNSLSAALSALRKELGDDAICADRNVVGLSPNTFSTDVSAFDAALRENDFARAVGLYRGSLLPGFDEDFFVPIAREYEEKARAAFSAQLQLLEPHADWTALRSLARRSGDVFGNDENSFGALMRAHYGLGELEAALRTYEDWQKWARRENEIVSDAARQLARKIRREREAQLNAPPVSNNSNTMLSSSQNVASSTRTGEKKDKNNVVENEQAQVELQLPTMWTRFFGREDEIAALTETLQKGERFVTLTGMGGTGKTRLLIEVARRVAAHWSNRVYFVSLAALSDAELLFSTIRDALQLPVAPDLPPLQQIVATLKDAPVLLLLDNFEQLVEKGAPQIQQLRAALPDATFLLTSRVLLRLPGECEWTVAPLPTPSLDADYEDCASTSLFLDRAQTARPDFQITPQNARDVAALCRRLDGVPLALELAAARIRVLAPAQILERLEKQLDFLQTREIGVPERQRTLRATIEWSYDQLPPAQRDFFCRLSVFRGGWTLEAAEQICDDANSAIDVLDSLEQLREYSMIVTYDVQNGTRFRVLEVLREWGANQLSRDETLCNALRERHFAWYLQFAESTRDARSLLQRATELEAENGNFRAALSWAIERNDARAANDAARLASALCAWWESRTLFSEGREWTLRVLRKDGEVETQWRARLLCGAGSISVCCGDLVVAQSLLEEGLALCRAREDRWSESFVLHRLSVVSMLRGHIARAVSQGHQSLALAREIGDSSLLLGAFVALGWALHNDFQHDETQRVFHECLAVCNELGIERLALVTKGFMGYSFLLQGHIEQAMRWCDEGLEQAQSGSHDDWCLGLAQALRGVIARETGDLARARTFSPQALARFYRIGTRWEVASALNDCAMLACDLKQFSVSAQLLGAADALATHIGYRTLPSIECLREPRMKTLQTQLHDDLPREMQAGAGMSLEDAIELAQTLQTQTLQ